MCWGRKVIPGAGCGVLAAQCSVVDSQSAEEIMQFWGLNLGLLNARHQPIFLVFIVDVTAFPDGVKKLGDNYGD